MVSDFLVLGHGLLGSELVRQTGWDCVSIELDGFDVLDTDCYYRMDNYKQIINCTGFTQNHKDKKRNLEMNIKPIVSLVDYCNRHHKKYIHISTDIVYGGSPSNASEDNVPVHAPNWYAFSKLVADGIVQALSDDYLIIRTAFKPRPFPYRQAYRKIGNFDYVDTIAELMIQIIEQDAEGVYNVGTQIKTMYQHALETVPNIRLAAETELVDVTMNLDRMKGLL